MGSMSGHGFRAAVKVLECLRSNQISCRGMIGLRMLEPLASCCCSDIVCHLPSPSPKAFGVLY